MTSEKELNFIRKILLMKGNYKTLIALLPGTTRTSALKARGVSGVDQMFIYLDIIRSHSDDKGQLYTLTEKGKILATSLKALLESVTTVLPGESNEGS